MIYNLVSRVNTPQLSVRMYYKIIDMYTRNKASLYIILLDASQAFDRVDYCKLFELLFSRNILNRI